MLLLNLDPACHRVCKALHKCLFLCIPTHTNPKLGLTFPTLLCPHTPIQSKQIPAICPACVADCYDMNKEAQGSHTFMPASHPARVPGAAQIVLNCFLNCLETSENKAAVKGPQ